MSSRRGVGVLAGAVLVLSACGGGDDVRTGGAVGPSDPPSSASPASPSVSPEAEPSGGAEPSEPSDPAARPATGGPTLRTRDGVSMTLPVSFREAQRIVGGSNAIINRAEDLTEVSLTTGPLIGELDVERYHEIARQSTESLPRFRVLPDIELFGQPAHHFVNDLTEFQREDRFGVFLIEEDLDISLRFTTLKEMPRAEREELIGSVLASLRLP